MNDPMPPSDTPPPNQSHSQGPPPPDEEVSHLDDKIIGRAFRWSALALVLLVGAAVGVVLVLNRKPPPAPTQVTPLSAPVAPSRVAAEMPTVKFTDVTAAAGITFVHNSGAAGEKLLPETMGSGVAVLDFDNDGDQDLLFVNGTYWPGKKPAGSKPTTPALYRNAGKGRFDDVTAGSGLDTSFYGTGVAVGDYDNDGWVDVFVGAVGQSKLFRNGGEGKFTEVAAQAGVAGTSNQWSTSCAWIDYNNDGLLDLFVANYVQWSREIDFEVDYKLDGIGRAYGPPMNFPGSFPYLYRNNGKGSFVDVSAESGVQQTNTFSGAPLAKSLGVAPVDLDRDGWIDLIVANDTVPNFVFHNSRDGRFQEIGASSSIAFDNYGQTRGAMGIDAGYYRNDETLAVAIGNFANEMTALYVSQQNPLFFTDDAISEGVGPASRLLLKFGVFFFDYDLDGRLDLLTSNGHLEAEIAKTQKSQHYAQPAQLFWNAGSQQGATFVPVPPEKAGQDLFKPIVGRGSAFGDLDGDGDLDVALTQTGGAPLVLRNDQQLHRHWLRLKLIGTSNNRDAIGALIKVKVGGKTMLRQVMPSRSYLSQSELPVTIGLGEATSIEALEITWPGGRVQSLPGPAIDQMTTVREERRS